MNDPEFEDSDFEYEDIDERLLVPDTCPDAEAALELRSLMSDISEDHYAAGWLIGLEFDLWRLIFEAPENTFGFSTLSFESRSKLIELTYRCKGWWIHSDTYGGRKFLTYDEWLPMYQKGRNASM
jgi:hypothetical protein